MLAILAILQERDVSAMEDFLIQLTTRIKMLDVGECLLVPGTWITPEATHTHMHMQHAHTHIEHNTYVSYMHVCVCIYACAAHRKASSWLPYTPAHARLHPCICRATTPCFTRYTVGPTKSTPSPSSRYAHSIIKY